MTDHHSRRNDPTEAEGRSERHAGAVQLHRPWSRPDPLGRWPSANPGTRRLLLIKHDQLHRARELVVGGVSAARSASLTVRRGSSPGVHRATTACRECPDLHVCYVSRIRCTIRVLRAGEGQEYEQVMECAGGGAGAVGAGPAAAAAPGRAGVRGDAGGLAGSAALPQPRRGDGAAAAGGGAAVPAVHQRLAVVLAAGGSGGVHRPAARRTAGPVDDPVLPRRPAPVLRVRRRPTLRVDRSVRKAVRHAPGPDLLRVEYRGAHRGVRGRSRPAGAGQAGSCRSCSTTPTSVPARRGSTAARAG
jgi:hypothetical protein